MSSSLQRFTTDYVVAEDRIRLAGETGDAAPVVVWLTLRLLQRVLPVLLKWLERQDGASPGADVVRGFAQQAARAELPLQAPVRAAADSAAWLANSVDISHGTQGLRLTLRGAEGQSVSLDLAAKPLRQWLGIVHELYLKGEWPLGAWPAWLCESAQAAAPQAALLH